MERHVVVIDIDGVLADVRHRLHHLAARPKDWDSFFSEAPQDELLDTGAQLARHVFLTHDVVYLTGRPERLRNPTQMWLDSHGLPPGRLLMRRNGDRRPSVTLKMHELRELRRRSSVDLLVDDDKTVIEAARAAGFAVRHADWMPAPQAVGTGDTRYSHRAGGHPPDDTLFDLLHEAQEREGRT